jgi:hypothetical protein
MAPAVIYVVTPKRASQLEGQKQGITRFGFTGAHDIEGGSPVVQQACDWASKARVA